MQQTMNTLADEIIRMVEANRSAINALDYGEISFRAHQGRLVEMTGAKTVKLTASLELKFLPLKDRE